MLSVVANDATEDLRVHQRPIEECRHRGRAFDGIDRFERHCTVVSTSLFYDRERQVLEEDRHRIACDAI